MKVMGKKSSDSTKIGKKTVGKINKYYEYCILENSGGYCINYILSNIGKKTMRISLKKSSLKA